MEEFLRDDFFEAALLKLSQVREILYKQIIKM